MILLLALCTAFLMDGPPSMEEIEQWLTYYYLKPRPELTLPSLAVIDRELQKHGRSLADEAGRGGMRSFYAQVFAHNPYVVDEAVRKLPSLPASQQAFVREALRRCGAPYCGDVLKTSLSQPEAPKELDPGALDDLWAAYFATGEARYVLEIIDALKGAQFRGDLNRVAAASAARWSLSSNAYQHGSVLAICEDAAARSTGATRDVLQVLVAQAKEQRAASPPREPGFSIGQGPARPAPAPTPSPQWPAGVPKPDLSGFWKNDCAENFGLKIAPAGKDLYSISFCGPGGCFEPGSYRPNSAIFGDPLYRVKDANTIEVLGADGFSTYRRCGDRP
jgi:hypothetical protein